MFLTLFGVQLNLLLSFAILFSTLVYFNGDDPTFCFGKTQFSKEMDWERSASRVDMSIFISTNYRKAFKKISKQTERNVKFDRHTQTS